MRGRAARGPDGDALPRPAHVPGFGWISVRPLAYGDVIRFFENNVVQSPERWAAMFRTALPGLENVTAEDVEQMYAGLPSALEYVICEASGLTDEDDEPDEPAEDQGMFAPPEEAIDNAENYKECDQIYALHQHGYTYDEIYRLLIPELDALFEGVERAVDRREDDGGQSSKSIPSEGNRGGSHANDLFR